MKRWKSILIFALPILFFAAPWRPAVFRLAHFAEISTVHAQTVRSAYPINPALAAPVPLPQGSCTPQAPAGTHGITVCWNATTVAGYNVYVSTTAGGPYTKANSATITGTVFFFPTGTLGGAKEFFVVRSFDGVAESANSTEVSATGIPNPLPPTGVQAVSI